MRRLWIGMVALVPLLASGQTGIWEAEGSAGDSC